MTWIFWYMLFLTDLKRDVKTIKKKNLNYANCALKLSTGASVHNQPQIAQNYCANLLALRFSLAHFGQP